MTTPAQTLQFFDALADLFGDLASQARATDAINLGVQSRHLVDRI